MKVNCPTCAKSHAWTTKNPFRPFCSDRCRLIDLGEWASDGHRIAGNAEESELFSGDLPADNVYPFDRG